MILFYGLPIATVHVVGLGLPLYLWLRWHGEVPIWATAIAGLACGGLPVFILLGGARLSALIFALAGLMGGITFHAMVAHASNREGRPVAGPPFDKAGGREA